VGGLVAVAQPASADTLTFFLNTPECTGACSILPTSIPDNLSVQAVIDRSDTTHATVTFTGPGGAAIDAPVGINVNGAYVALGTNGLAPTNPCGFGITACATGNTNHLGSFNTETSGGNPLAIVISLTAANGNTWADAASVLKANTNAAAIYGHGFEAFVENHGTQYGGFYSATPVPAALPLFVSGLGTLGVVGWRRKRKLQAT
jgi:hypothetical protein